MTRGNKMISSATSNVIPLPIPEIKNTNFEVNHQIKEETKTESKWKQLIQIPTNLLFKPKAPPTKRDTQSSKVNGS